MPETTATILIPDISGFTEFMTSTELTHGAHAINYLIEAIVKAVGEEYEVAEIEGDAVLLIKKGPAPSKKEVRDICLRIFNDFHVQRKWMQKHTICPCGACQGLINLTLKFVAHHGPVAEIKIGRFVKQSGPEMIVAHRLLKNSINSNEYLLLTEKLLQQVEDSAEAVDMEWVSSSEEYASIGKVDYHFALLSEARKKIPDPPDPQDYYRSDNASRLEIPIAANYRDVYMELMNIPARAEWVPELQKVEQEFPTAFIGSIHHCTFNYGHTTISPLRMTITEEGIMYAESCLLPEFNLSLVYEYVCKKLNEETCGFACRFMNTNESPIPEDLQADLYKRMQEMADGLKGFCEKMDISFFEPSYRDK